MMVIPDYTYEQGKIIAENLRADVDKWSAILSEFPRSTMGLTPDDVKKGEKFKTAKSQYDYYFSKLQLFNSGFTKRYKNEILKERRAKCEALKSK